jgi:hypothetical protein
MTEMTDLGMSGIENGLPAHSHPATLWPLPLAKTLLIFWTVWSVPAA